MDSVKAAAFALMRPFRELREAVYLSRHEADTGDVAAGLIIE